MTREGSAHLLRTCAAAVALTGTLVLGGCGGGVEFEGKAFEMMGLGSEGKREDEEMADRAPLVMPPRQQLPEPGARADAEEPENWPEDPELRKQKQMAEAEAERERYYREGKKEGELEAEDFGKSEFDRRPGIFGDLSVSIENRGDPVSDNGS